MDKSKIDVITASLIHRSGNYVLNQFLNNLKQIQKDYPATDILLASAESETCETLKELMISSGLNGTVIHYDIVKPDYAKDRIWNITCGREALRKYALKNSQAGYFLFLDSDMVFEPQIITKMKREIQDCDVLFSGYPLKKHGIGLAGFGCLMLKRTIMERLQFRCYEFKNGEVIYEDNLLEMDAFLKGAKIKKGFFLNIKHYLSAEKYKDIKPQPVGLAKRIVNNAALRCFFIWLSVKFKYNLLWNLKKTVNKHN